MRSGIVIPLLLLFVVVGTRCRWILNQAVQVGASVSATRRAGMLVHSWNSKNANFEIQILQCCTCSGYYFLISWLTTFASSRIVKLISTCLLCHRAMLKLACMTVHVKTFKIAEFTCCFGKIKNGSEHTYWRPLTAGLLNCRLSWRTLPSCRLPHGRRFHFPEKRRSKAWVDVSKRTKLKTKLTAWPCPTDAEVETIIDVVSR